MLAVLLVQLGFLASVFKPQLLNTQISYGSIEVEEIGLTHDFI